MIEPIKHATHITSYGATPPPPTAVAVVPSSYDVHDHDTTDEDDDDEIEALDAAKGATSTWRSWYRSLLKFFRGLGKFFLILAVGTVVLVLVLQYTLPSVDEEQRKDLHFPHSLEDLEALRKILSVYMDKHYYRVMVGFLTVYLYLQTFSVPGSMWLSILGGALFKFWIALTMVSLASAVGATNCYLLSRHFFSKLVKRKFGDRMEKWNTQLERHRNNLMSYIILLRLAPFPPNWFVNICSPHLHVPLWPEFFLGTLIGVTAPSVVHVQAGSVLEKLVEDHSSGVNVFTLKNVLMLGAVALLAALPVLIRWVLARHEARKVGIVVGSEDEERAALLGDENAETSETTTDPILEPLDPTGVIIPAESQHFHRPRSQRTLSTSQDAAPRS
ncbi:hypothetical protein BGZ59_002415 [Podila verticillata]|nr:hypothetical protein BGZ59_002415 [Podila verticillata]KAI9234233.1 MAG: snare associated Golgi protein-domain-containing protein [Podila humilis]KFH72658.1 hypothetical protein MVEG_02947 [Podila verticillata NRRL 6337]